MIYIIALGNAIVERTRIERGCPMNDNCQTTPDARLDAMITIADQLDVPLDDVFALMADCPDSAFAAFCETPSSLPLYIKSSDNP